MSPPGPTDTNNCPSASHRTPVYRSNPSAPAARWRSGAGETISASGRYTAVGCGYAPDVAANDNATSHGYRPEFAHLRAQVRLLRSTRGTRRLQGFRQG